MDDPRLLTSITGKQSNQKKIMNIFEQATIQKLRFSTNKGEVTTEQLWDMPLQSKNQFDLDSLAKAVNGELKSVTEESFVNTKPSPAKSLLELKLDVIKHIIAAKIKTHEEQSNARAKAAKREKLLNILSEKQDEALKSLSPEELAKQIAELS